MSEPKVLLTGQGIPESRRGPGYRPGPPQLPWGQVASEITAAAQDAGYDVARPRM
jgi:hypothetical protein